MTRTFVAFAIILASITTVRLVAQEPAPNPATPGTGAKRALLVCGLSGDANHHKVFAETIVKVHAALTGKLGFAATDVEILFGDEPQAEDAAPIQSAGRATREELVKCSQLLREKSRPEDTLWVFTFGHTYYDGQNSWFNLPGPDLHQDDFAKCFAGLAGQQVFVLTTPTSGFYIKPLSFKNRVVISATEADWETNETEFATELAKILSTPPSAKELDVDQDQQITLFDLYIAVVRNLAQSYRDRELLATEHPLLDDNADGRGTELQIDFLIPELGGRAKANNPVLPTISANADGHLAKSIRLSITE